MTLDITDRVSDVFEDSTRELPDAVSRLYFLRKQIVLKNISAWNAHVIWRRIYHTSFTPFKREAQK